MLIRERRAPGRRLGGAVVFRGYKLVTIFYRK